MVSILAFWYFPYPFLSFTLSVLLLLCILRMSSELPSLFTQCWKELFAFGDIIVAVAVIVGNTDYLSRTLSDKPNQLLQN